MPDFLLGFETGSDFFDLALPLPLETDSASFGIFESSFGMFELDPSCDMMDATDGWGEEIEFLVSLVVG